MARLSTLTMTGVAILCVVLALPTAAQSPTEQRIGSSLKEQLVGSWSLPSELRRISRWKKELQSSWSQPEGTFDVRCEFIFVPDDRR